MFRKRGLMIVAALALAACEQAQMHGPIVGGSVTVTDLRSGVVSHEGTATATEEQTIPLYGEEAWDGFSDYVKLLLLGIHQFGAPAFDADSWYLMAVEGGEELDHGKTFSLDSQPFQVQGSVHALVKGELLNEGSFTLSPVTEAAWQFVRDRVDDLSDAEILAALDDIAGDLVGDVDDNGSVDYADVLTWNRLLHLPFLVADANAIDDLAAAMEEGQSASTVQSIAIALFSTDSPLEDAETVFADAISEVVQRACGPGCHTIGGIGASRSAHVLLPVSEANHITENVQMYRALVQAKGVEFIINKATRNGVSHGGGAAFRSDADAAAFESFLRLL